MNTVHSPGSLVDLVLQHIFEFNNTTASDLAQVPWHNAETCRHHLTKIQSILDSGRPIPFVLPAFPFKSMNYQKTLGMMPDFGEVLALKRLNGLCTVIADHYEPGATLVIASDGRVFNDLVGVPDGFVSAYHAGIDAIINEFRMDHLATFSLDQARDHAGSDQDKRSWLVAHYAEPLPQIEAEVEEPGPKGLEARLLFNGIKHFLSEDQVVFHPTFSRRQLRKVCGPLSCSVIQRSRAWGALLEEKYPDAVRLSIHPQPLSSKKIGIRLVESTDPWRTPWHSVALCEGNRTCLVKRREAEERGATLNLVSQKYFCYSIGNIPEFDGH